MRNIALLEWGPASLFYIQPREQIKVRTQWLEGGPQLPPFLSSMEDFKANSESITVRYALSAFEDLNNVIRNLRICFGFPYQEYIGYLNSLTRKHRARREHEGLLSGLRRWAIFGNIDAVVWIDYAKSNQPPGSFKMGPHDSVPFHARHMEICAKVTDSEDYAVRRWRDADESEGSGFSADEDHVGGADSFHWGEVPYGESSRRPSRSADGVLRTTPGGGFMGGLRHPVLRSRKAARETQPTSSRGPARGSMAVGATKSTASAASTCPPHPPASSSDQRWSQSKDRPALQEEFIPAHGSIYSRSIAPGPGYYGQGALQTSEHCAGPSFGPRTRSQMDRQIELSVDFPPPGHYEPKPGLADAKKRLGKFGKAMKALSPPEAAKKLPFIPNTSDNFGAESPGPYINVVPGAHSAYTQSPKFSFGKLRRPF